MHQARTDLPDPLRIELAHAVGYPNYPDDAFAEPHLNYITARNLHRGTQDEYIRLFIRVVTYFNRKRSEKRQQSERRTIQALLDDLAASDTEDIFADTEPNSRFRKEDVEDTVLFIFGVWSMMLSSFLRIGNDARGIREPFPEETGKELIHGADHNDYKSDLADFIRSHGLLPSPWGWEASQRASVEDEVIEVARKLVTLLSGRDDPYSQSGSQSDRLAISAASKALESRTMGGRIACRTVDDIDVLESMSIKAIRLNAYTLNVFGALDIYWTHDISRHMLLTQRGGRFRIEIFALPCAFQATTLTSEAVGISTELAQEVKESYAILFNPWPDSSFHSKLGIMSGLRKICPCWSCSARRFRSKTIAAFKEGCTTASHKSRKTKHILRLDSGSGFDPLLEQLMNGKDASDWTYELFPHLWQRITLLEAHLQRAKPWSIWVLFRDRRDTLQFWTFLFATVVVLLTLVQVALGVAQVAGSFR